jgi:uncharacterized protein (DUF2235 family)
MTIILPIGEWSITDMSKNIVICCDGTDNQFSGQQTNVIRLYKCAKYIPIQQVTYYDPGVGTMPAPGLYTKLAKRISVLLGLVTGFGFMQNLEDAYRFLMQNYEEGDRVYLFGFSRGAFTVRALAGMLYAVGLLRPGTDNLIPYARRYWRKCYTKNGLEVANDFKNTLSRECKPHFVGVWDTVASIGWFNYFKVFPHTRHNPDIAIFRHAVSIDERRCCFRQNLADPDITNPKQSVMNVWFSGVHSDIGGGYPEAESGLSKITFQWITEEAHNAGLIVDDAIFKMEVGQIPMPDGTMLTSPNPEAMLHKSLHGLWWLLELLPRREWNPADHRWHWTWGAARPRQMPKDPLVYKSVPERIKSKLVPPYCPVNLPAQYQIIN